MTTSTPQPQAPSRLEDLIPDAAQAEAGSAELPGHVAAVREWSEAWVLAWNSRDIDAILALVDEDFCYDDVTTWDGPLNGKDEFREYLEMVFRAFPDLKFEPTDWPVMFSLDGRHAAVASRAIATFSGDMRGGTSPLVLAPTNATIDLFCLDLYEFEGGVLRRWTALNKEVEMLRQIGVIPAGLPLQVAQRVQRLAAAVQRRLR